MLLRLRRINSTAALPRRLSPDHTAPPLRCTTTRPRRTGTTISTDSTSPHRNTPLRRHPRGAVHSSSRACTSINKASSRSNTIRCIRLHRLQAIPRRTMGTRARLPLLLPLRCPHPPRVRHPTSRHVRTSPRLPRSPHRRRIRLLLLPPRRSSSNSTWRITCHRTSTRTRREATHTRRSGARSSNMHSRPLAADTATHPVHRRGPRRPQATRGRRCSRQTRTRITHSRGRPQEEGTCVRARRMGRGAAARRCRASQARAARTPLRAGARCAEASCLGWVGALSRRRARARPG